MSIRDTSFSLNSKIKGTENLHLCHRGAGSQYRANDVEVEDFQEYESEQEQVLSLSAELESDLYVFSARCGPNDKDKVDILVDCVPVKFLPDTGSSVTVIDRSTYDMMCQSGTYPVFRTDAKIYAYGSDDPLKLKGYINAKLSINKRCSIVTIFVLNARKCGNLLSKKACQNLGVIEMCETQAPTNISGIKFSTYTGVNQVTISERQRKEEVNISHSGKTNTPGSTETNVTEGIRKVLDKFPEGIGRMKDVELKLDIDESITPVAQTTRRIPFSQRGAVEEKIGELLREGIIERVEGPTPWLSPIHVVRQEDKAEVRSCIGLVNFIGKFIPNFSTRIAPISSMLSKEAVFVWGEAQEEAFQSVLEEIRSPRILQYFDPKKETSLIVDASPVGLCGILAQEDKPVLFVSRKLTKVESRYSQTEREALSVV